MNTKERWAGEFGDEYTKRNRVDWIKRVPVWNMILGQTGSRSVFEFGCNAGWNLSAIKECSRTVRVYGCDINEKALEQARMAGLRVFLFEDDYYYYIDPCELSFTAGVLIHIAPENLTKTMQTIIDHSRDYVLAIEYDAEEETEVEYRGESGMLWKRPYGQIYQDMGLTLIETGKLQMDVGFDNCRYWLLRK